MNDPAPLPDTVHRLEYGKSARPALERWIGGAVIAIALLFLGACLWAFLLSPNRYPEPANRVRCASNMRTIGQAIAMYANEHNNVFPDSLATVLENEDLATATFICPSSNDMPAAGPTSQAIANALTAGGHLSYIYVGKGLTATTVTPDMVLLYEPTSNHLGNGMNVMFGDFHVEWMTGSDVASILRQAKTGVRPIRLPSTTRPTWRQKPN